MGFKGEFRRWEDLLRVGDRESRYELLLRQDRRPAHFAPNIRPRALLSLRGRAAVCIRSAQRFELPETKHFTQLSTA